jgi:hypothetical protein
MGVLCVKSTVLLYVPHKKWGSAPNPNFAPT